MDKRLRSQLHLRRHRHLLALHPLRNANRVDRNLNLPRIRNHNDGRPFLRHIRLRNLRHPPPAPLRNHLQPTLHQRLTLLARTRATPPPTRRIRQIRHSPGNRQIHVSLRIHHAQLETLRRSLRNNLPTHPMHNRTKRNRLSPRLPLILPHVLSRRNARVDTLHRRRDDSIFRRRHKIRKRNATQHTHLRRKIQRTPARPNLHRRNDVGLRTQPQKTIRLLLITLLLTAASLAISRYITPFDIVWAQLLLSAMMIGTLIYNALNSRFKGYLYIALFALGSIAFFYSADYMLNQVMQPHQRVRINVLLGLDEDLAGAGYNVHQSEIAIGSGGLQGKGFLNGTQTKLKFVPEQDTDFIFCTVGEEEGFLGSATVLLLFLALILRLMYLAERQSFKFGRVYGYCVAGIFLFHVFINVGMVLGLTPVIGIPLPFFSYGGSSLWGFTLLLFIFLRIDAGRNLIRQ